MRSYLLILTLLLVSCSSVSQKQSAALSRAVYSTEKAIRAGRYDLAARYSEQTVRLIPPPKKKPVVSPITFKGTRFVVLPVEQKDVPTLSIGSQSMDALLSESKAVAGQLKAENRAVESVERTGDKVLIKKEEVLNKAEKDQVVKDSKVWSKVKSWASWLSLLAVIGALLYFAPVVIPVVYPILQTLGQFIGFLIRKVFNRNDN